MVKVRTGQRISDDTTVFELRGISQKMGHRFFDISTSCLIAVENDDAPTQVVVPKVEKAVVQEDDEPKNIKKIGKKR